MAVGSSHRPPPYALRLPFFRSARPELLPGDLASLAEALLGQLHALGGDGDHVCSTVHLDLALDGLVELGRHGERSPVQVSEFGSAGRCKVRATDDAVEGSRPAGHRGRYRGVTRSVAT